MFNRDFLQLNVRPSKLLLVLHLSVFLIALVSLILNDAFQASMKFAIGFALVLCCGWLLHGRVLLWHPLSVIQVIFDSGKWRLRYRNGQTTSADLLPGVLVSEWFLVLVFTTPQKERIPVVIAKDATPAGVYRQCRVFFRFGVPSRV